MSGVGVQLTATPQGLPRLSLALGQMVALGASPRPLWDALGQYGESSTRLRFRRQMGPDGRRWVPSRRAQAYGPGRTLIQSARLLRSITYSADNTGAEWGTNVVYAGIHQFGGVITARQGGALRFRMPGGGWVTVRRVRIPARPFLGVNAEDGEELAALATEVVEQAANARRR